MFETDKSLKPKPLERLISLRGRFSYLLRVKTQSGQIKRLNCEFQTNNEFIFSSQSNDFNVGDILLVEVRTLSGPVWNTCELTYIETHKAFYLYQFAITKTGMTNHSSRGNKTL